MQPRAVLAAVLASVVVGGGVAASATLAGDPGLDGRALVDRPIESSATARSAATREPTPRQTEPRPSGEPSASSVLDTSAEVTVEVEGFLAWAALDRTTGARVASPNATETSSTESMIKAWIVADFLRRLAERDREPTDRDLRDARRSIRDSHNGAANRLYLAGGADDVVRRMIRICRLADTYIPEGGSGWWSRTEMSAEDAVRLGDCLADGTAAGRKWTDWVLAEMRRVRGTTAPEDQRAEEGFEGGRWGIIDGLPEDVADDVSIKNGWTRIGRTNSWHVNCLAVTVDWVMAVMMRYPAEYSLDYGAQRCADVARQLVGDEPEPSAPSGSWPAAR